MARALVLSLAQLGDPRILRVLLVSLAITLALFAAAGGALGAALDGADPCAWVGWLGECQFDGVEGSLTALLLSLAALWFLFPAVAIGVVSLFSDRIVEVVEMRHYPAAAATARSVGWGELAALGLASAGRLVLLNLLALPLYLILLVTGVGVLVLGLVVNGYALGRDLSDMVAVRHLDPPARASWRQRTRAARFLLGLGVAALFLIPFVNLLAPVLGAAMATHFFHRSRA
ncbi:EI24 domain-containing protein [Sphingomonas jatrophae]|nr:EI24 domain-containing protein [Sphingomonas jatrophae]